MKTNIILTTGPMFSGKTSWLIKELNKKNLNEVLTVKYFLDDRYDNLSLATHDGIKLNAKSAKNENDILGFLKEKPNTKYLGIDELQFFNLSIVRFIEDLKKKDIEILTAGLNVDHNNKEWETTNALRGVADRIIELKAICAACGKKNATISNRKTRRDERVVIGGAELYESLCEKDYEAVSKRGTGSS